MRFRLLYFLPGFDSTERQSFVTPGKSLCANDQNMSALQQLLCAYQYGQSFNPAHQVVYINGLPQWKTRNAVNILEKAGNDYLVTPGLGAHKLHIRKLSWNRARKICIQEGGEFLFFSFTTEIVSDGETSRISECRVRVSSLTQTRSMSCTRARRRSAIRSFHCCINDTRVTHE